MNLKFSFVIPVYNTEKYLDECISAILSQSYNDYEIIIVDDGSTDSSAEICGNFAKIDNRIIFEQTKNGGPAKIRNVGIKKATGDYIWFFDSDDRIFDNNCLLELNDILSQNTPDMLFFLSHNYNEDLTDLLKTQPNYKYDGYLPISGEQLLTNLKEFNKIMSLATSPVNKIIKASVLKENNLFFVEHFRWHAEDEFLNKVISNSSGFYFYNKELYKVRIRPKSITTTVTPKILERKFYTKVELVDICLKYFDSHSFSQALKQTMATYYSYYYLFGFRDFFGIKQKAQRRKMKKYIKSHPFVFVQMGKTNSSNLRRASIIYRSLGLNAFLLAIKIRYKL